MSNVDTAKSAFQAFRTGDLATLKENMAEDVLWWSSDETKPGGEFRGIDQVMQMFISVPEHWTRFEVDPVEYIDAGDRVVVLGTTTVENSRGSDTARWAQVLTFNSDGLVTASEIHSDSAKGYKLQQ